MIISMSAPLIVTARLPTEVSVVPPVVGEGRMEWGEGPYTLSILARIMSSSSVLPKALRQLRCWEIIPEPHYKSSQIRMCVCLSQFLTSPYLIASHPRLVCLVASRGRCASSRSPTIQTAFDFPINLSPKANMGCNVRLCEWAD